MAARCNPKPESKTFASIPFHIDIWLTLCVVNWICDFGRPIASLAAPLEYFPLKYPSLGDYFHLTYNLLVPFCLLKLLERSSYKLSSNLQYLLVILFTIGASLHLVADTVDHRLIHLGYQNHLSVRENPLIKNVSSCLTEHNPQGPLITEVFELLYFYDETLGHNLWYIPEFSGFTLFFLSSFVRQEVTQSLPAVAWFLLPFDALFTSYLVAEGQIALAFGVALMVMVTAAIFFHFRGYKADVNGQYLLSVYVLTVGIVAGWSLYFWDHKVLRERYPGLLYIPEPWSVYTLWKVGLL